MLTGSAWPHHANPCRGCAAARGNGAQVFVQLASLARFHELVGRLWGGSPEAVPAASSP